MSLPLEIPTEVTAPAHSGQPQRVCKVAGHGFIKRCLNPKCQRRDPEGMLTLLLEPGNIWPNIVVECGLGRGCGAFWGMVGAPPQGVTLYDEDSAYHPPQL